MISLAPSGWWLVSQFLGLCLGWVYFYGSVWRILLIFPLCMGVVTVVLSLQYVYSHNVHFNHVTIFPWRKQLQRGAWRKLRNLMSVKKRLSENVEWQCFLYEIPSLATYILILLLKFNIYFYIRRQWVPDLMLMIILNHVCAIRPCSMYNIVIHHIHNCVQSIITFLPHDYSSVRPAYIIRSNF